MAYTINKYNGSVLTVVEDGTIDSSTDIKLVGKNYAGYGEIQNENFVYLLENFANLNPPPRPVAGQIWFDSNQSKLKFYDGDQFRTTGGAEISSTTPEGLTEGDFWWDTQNEQLYAYNGNNFVLVGPQDAGEGITQMQSRTVTDIDGGSYSVIVSVINDEIVTVFSNSSFTLPSGQLPGFDVIKKGVTLKNTLNSTGGVSTDDFVYWGTASNALKLGGVDASQFVQSGEAGFDSLVEFADVGYAVGDSNDLRVFIENDNQAVISNEVGEQIKIKAKNSQGTVKNSFRFFADSVLPGIDDNTSALESVNIGSESQPFSDVHAENFIGLSEKASALVVSGEDRTGSINASANTVAIRDASGDLKANLFRGTALTAKYADLAEKYTTAEQYPVGTVMTVCKHVDHETCAAAENDIPVGVISEKPAFLMNEDADGQALALKGRVPVRTIGKVSKGDALYSAGDGIASTIYNNMLVGIALESSDAEEEKLIEAILKL